MPTETDTHESEPTPSARAADARPPHPIASVGWFLIGTVVGCAALVLLVGDHRLALPPLFVFVGVAAAWPGRRHVVVESLIVFVSTLTFLLLRNPESLPPHPLIGDMNGAIAASVAWWAMGRILGRAVSRRGGRTPVGSAWGALLAGVAAGPFAFVLCAMLAGIAPVIGLFVGLILLNAIAVGFQSALRVAEPDEPDAAATAFSDAVVGFLIALATIPLGQSLAHLGGATLIPDSTNFAIPVLCITFGIGIAIGARQRGGAIRAARGASRSLALAAITLTMLAVVRPLLDARHGSGVMPIGVPLLAIPGIFLGTAIGRIPRFSHPGAVLLGFCAALYVHFLVRILGNVNLVSERGVWVTVAILGLGTLLIAPTVSDGITEATRGGLDADPSRNAEGLEP